MSHSNKNSLWVKYVIILLACYPFNTFGKNAIKTSQNETFGTHALHFGFGSNTSSPNYPYFHVGYTKSLNTIKSFYFTSDILYGHNTLSYSFSENAKYSYRNQRFSIGAGVNFLPCIINRLRMGFGVNLLSTHFQSKLSTDNEELNNLLLSEVFRDKLRFSFAILSQFEISKKSGIYAKVNLHGKEKTYTHHRILTLGYQWRFNNNLKLPDTSKINRNSY